MPEDRSKKKGKKRTGKKFEFQSLMGMFNKQIKKYDSVVSIRYILQNNKIDMIWMDLVVWFPNIYRELKRFCIRVLKKRMLKFITISSIGFQSTFFQ